MMKSRLVALAGLVSIFVLGANIGGSAAWAKPATKTFEIKGWSCSGCAQHTTEKVEKIPGVTKATSDYDKKSVTVTFDDEKTSGDAIKKAIKELKYDCCDKDEKKEDKKDATGAKK